MKSVNPLTALLSLPAAEKEKLGVVHTPQEISQQPSTWLRTRNLVHAQLPEICSFLTAAGVKRAADKRPTVYLVGAGTSDYTGQSLHYLLRTKWQCEVIPVSSTDLLIDFNDYLLDNRPYLWISFSRSGDSPEGVAVLERALAEKPEIAQLVVSCNATGQMSRLIHGKPNTFGILLNEETNDKGLAMTGSFTNMVIAGHALAHAWSAGEYERIIDAICQAGEAFLPIAADLAHQLAEKTYPRACFIGSGTLAGVARESALKLLELTAGRTKTMSQATLALRHGPMAALDEETLFVSFLSTNKIPQRYEVDLIREIARKQLAAESIAVVGCGAATLPQLDATQILAPTRAFAVPDAYRPALDTIFGQLLGLFFSLRYNLTPDSPSPNGAITRVVQPIEIY